MQTLSKLKVGHQAQPDRRRRAATATSMLLGGDRNVPTRAGLARAPGLFAVLVEPGELIHVADRLQNAHPRRQFALVIDQ